MSEASTPPEPGALIHLAEAIERGRRIASRPALAPGPVRMWTGSVRPLLRKVFGPESPILRAWPTVDTQFPMELAREVLLERIGRLERLIGNVAAAAERALSPGGGNRIFIGHGRSPLW